jgi:hypothetical protein
MSRLHLRVMAHSPHPTCEAWPFCVTAVAVSQR